MFTGIVTHKAPVTSAEISEVFYDLYSQLKMGLPIA